MSNSEQVIGIETEASTQPSQSGMAGSAGLLAIGNAGSRVLGLVREVMIASFFGPTGEVSAFRIASQIPLLIYEFLVGGMLSAALVPVLSQYAERSRRVEFAKLVSVFATILGIVLLLLVIALELAAPQVAWLLAGGFQTDNPELIDLTIGLLRWSLPVVWFMCMAGLATATLYALERFSFPALGTSVYNLGIICVAPLLAARFGVAALVIGMIVGTMAQMSIMVVDLWRAGVRIQFHVDWQHPALRQVVRLYLPIAAGVVVSLFQVGLDRRLATGTEPESVAWMATATTLQQLPLGLISVAISMAALPRLSQYFAVKDEANYRSTLGRGLRMVLLLIVPAAMLLWILGEPVIRLVFERNKFMPSDTVQVAKALNIYVLGMVFAAIDYPLNFAFYARQNTRLPALVGVISVVFYLVAAWALLQPLGFLGLVWADTAKQIGHMVIMAVLLSWQVGMRRELLSFGTLWIVLAGVGAGVVTWLCATWLGPMLAPGFAHDVLLIVGAGGVGMVGYVLLLALGRVQELEMVTGWLQNRLGRRAAI